MAIPSNIQESTQFQKDFKKYLNFKLRIKLNPKKLRTNFIKFYIILLRYNRVYLFIFSILGYDEKKS